MSNLPEIYFKITNLQEYCFSDTKVCIERLILIHVEAESQRQQINIAILLNAMKKCIWLKFLIG